MKCKNCQEPVAIIERSSRAIFYGPFHLVKSADGKTKYSIENSDGSCKEPVVLLNE